MSLWGRGAGDSRGTWPSVWHPGETMDVPAACWAGFETLFVSLFLLRVRLGGAGWFCGSVSFGTAVTLGCGEQGTSLSRAVAQGWVSSDSKRVSGTGGLVVLSWGGAFVGPGGFGWVTEPGGCSAAPQSPGGEFGSFWCFWEWSPLSWRLPSAN